MVGLQLRNALKNFVRTGPLSSGHRVTQIEAYIMECFGLTVSDADPRFVEATIDLFRGMVLITTSSICFGGIALFLEEYRVVGFGLLVVPWVLLAVIKVIAMAVAR